MRLSPYAVWQMRSGSHEALHALCSSQTLVKVPVYSGVLRLRLPFLDSRCLML